MQVPEHKFKKNYEDIDGLVQDCSISSTLAMAVVLQSYIKPSIYVNKYIKCTHQAPNFGSCMMVMQSSNTKTYVFNSLSPQRYGSDFNSLSDVYMCQ